MAHNVTDSPAKCLEGTQSSMEEDTESKIRAFEHWAAGLGADMDAIEVRQSPQVRSKASTLL